MNNLTVNEKPGDIVLAQDRNFMAQAEGMRVSQEVQVSMLAAKKFPRDMAQVSLKINTECQRLGLAQESMYSYPRGGELVEGPSIRLAEALARNYGNLQYGVRELERRHNVSIAESYCWDLETNTRQTKTFEVPHERHTKKGVQRLTDARDIYEHVANYGARRLRACILGIIPVDITEEAVNQCRATIKKGGGEPLADRIKKLVIAFNEVGVSQKILEEKLKHEAALIVPDEIVTLTGIYKAIKDDHAKRADFFPQFKDEEVSVGKAAELSEKLKAETKTQEKK